MNSKLKLKYICEVESDNDGVPDVADYCPNSPPRARHDVDANSCLRFEVDIDRDGVCTAFSSEVDRTIPPSVSKWCSGVDNCELVYNPSQSFLQSNDTRIGDACNLGV